MSLSLRVDLPFMRRRVVLTEDRISLEESMLAWEWSPAAGAFLDEVCFLYRYRRRVWWYLVWFVVAGPLALVGLLMAFEDRGEAVETTGWILFLIGALIGALGLIATLRRRPFLRIESLDGKYFDVRMDQPAFRPGLRRRFFEALFKALSMPFPP